MQVESGASVEEQVRTENLFYDKFVEAFRWGNEGEEDSSGAARRLLGWADEVGVSGAGHVFLEFAGSEAPDVRTRISIKGGGVVVSLGVGPEGSQGIVSEGVLKYRYNLAYHDEESVTLISRLDPFHGLGVSIGKRGRIKFNSLP